MDLFQSPKFSARVKELMTLHHVPGLSVAVVQNETIASAGYGKASLDGSQPCTADTLFDIASASKSLTAASVALLVDDDDKYPDVKYEAAMSKLLPDDFVVAAAGYTESITVEDILSHRSGMAPHDSSYMSPRAPQPDDARSVTRNLRNLQVAAPIRTKYIYCNLMYTVATYLVENKTGISFTDFLETRIFAPLGMDSTNLQPALAREKGLGDRIATGYAWKEKLGEYKGFQTPDSPEAQGAGSIITSVNDYARWVKALVNQEDPINEAVYKGLVKSRTFQNPDSKDLAPFTSPIFYATGLEVFYYRGHEVVGHDGMVPGFASRHFFLPGHKFGAVILGNSEGAGMVAAILARELTDEVLGVPEAERPDWSKVMSETFYDPPSGDLSEEEEARQQLCPGIKESQPQEMPLSAYTGEYRNAGYHSIIVQIKDEKLYIDASDRSMGFMLTFDHVCEQTKYVVHLDDYLEGGDIPFRAEFVLEGDKAVKLGLHLEEEIGDEMIWFERV